MYLNIYIAQDLFSNIQIYMMLSEYKMSRRKKKFQLNCCMFSTTLPPLRIEKDTNCFYIVHSILLHVLAVYLINLSYPPLPFNRSLDA